jgi:GNAT superfamily N-acetyltransferase
MCVSVSDSALPGSIIHCIPLELTIADLPADTKSHPMNHTMLRQASVEDVDLILELILDLAAFEKLSHQVEATREQLQATLFGNKPAAEVVLAFERERAVGLAIFFHNFSSFLGKPGLHLEDLYVRPEFRGRGHGRALLKHLATLALERGCGRFEWTVLDWNTSAIEFYRRQGADVLPDWRICRVTGDALERLAH